ncbi:unnamed protein product, partial [Ectocarpus sp. 12 AP-2014]
MSYMASSSFGERDSLLPRGQQQRQRQRSSKIRRLLPGSCPKPRSVAVACGGLLMVLSATLFAGKNLSRPRASSTPAEEEPGTKGGGRVSPVTSVSAQANFLLSQQQQKEEEEESSSG